MASEQYNPSDLTSVLRTLSSLSTPGPPTPNGTSNPQIHQTNTPNDDAYEPPETMEQSSSYPNTALSTARPPPAPQDSVAKGNNTHPSTKQTSDMVDSSTITTWPAALRYVMRTVAQNEDMQRRIRRLIQSQHDHEEQWWQGRETLVKKHRTRVEKKKELDAVLRSVGAPVDDTKEVSTAEEDQVELNNYDAKVYKASTQMSEAMTLELRGLGIPFFSIKQSSVYESPQRNGQSSQSGNQQTLSRDDLSIFQRRMLELLQDLCKE